MNSLIFCSNFERTKKNKYMSLSFIFTNPPEDEKKKRWRAHYLLNTETGT